MQNPIPHPQQPTQRIPAPPTRAAQPPVKKSGKKRRKKRKSGRTMTLIVMMAVVFSLAMCAAVTVGAAVVISAGRIAPNVSAMGVDLSFQMEAQAAETLRGTMGAVMLTDEGRTWTMAASELGIALDANATAARAADVSLFSAFTQTQIAPVVSVNAESLRDALSGIAPQVELPASDAGFQLVAGDVQPVPAVYGRVLDVDASVAMMAANPASVLTDGQFELVMRDVAPAVADASALVEQARMLLASPLTVRGYDPIDDESIVRTVPAREWAAWLTADAGGTQLSLNTGDVVAYISGTVNPTLKSYQTINADEAAQQLSAAVAALNPGAQVRIRQTDKIHTVQAGETITSIAWDYGVPYPYIQQANPNAGTLSAGQQLTIPSAENFLLEDVVPNKRIVVSISGNWTRVYEDGGLKWDWASSTGINSSPTWPGVYQIISHEENAYAGNWNLNMPWFMGVYQPIPGSAFTNGFHGFPTRGGGQLLWENSLGTKVTYGCILLSNTNAKLLYDWAENGVIVEILP
ncbi:MAG: L,D-transpeptidase family protein [Chloroflexota bacterium]